MNRKGVCYDVGTIYGVNWRPDYNPDVTHRELTIIKNELHCNSVRIRCRDISRLMVTAEDALKQGFEVWLSPEWWDQSPEKTMAYTVRAAAAAERLNRDYPGRVVFSVGSELTLFMQGIVEGKTLMKRIHNAFSGDFVKSGKHNKPLNEYLAGLNDEVRKVFHGSVTYASLIWEQVDWNIFDIVGVDHYWDERIKDRYLDMLNPLSAFGKPVVITEFGFSTTNAPAVGGALSFGNIDNTSRFLHQLPVIGRFIRPHLNKIYERDESVQAYRLIDQLQLLDGAGVDGGFVSSFIFSINPYNDIPKYDLDRESSSLVKSFAGGQRGTTYPDMAWEPKESFKAISDFYAKISEG